MEKESDMKTYLFVCTGNTCRSCMAETIFKRLNETEYQKDCTAFSRGVAAPGSGASANAKHVMQHMFDADLSSHVSANVTKQDIEQADIIFAMTAGHLNRLHDLFPDSTHKIFLLSANGTDVTDPYGGSVSNYEACASQLETYVRRILEAA